MDNTPTPKKAVHLTLEVSRSQDGRMEGRADLTGTDSWQEFSGVLELLKVIEALSGDIEPVIPGTLTSEDVSE
jgi:hypothetical protein